jgi:hypothetical protein
MTDFRTDLEHAAQELELAENALLCSSFHNSAIRVKAAARRARAALAQPELQGPTLEQLIRALELAEAALADIGDAEREPGDDLAWAEARAAQDLPRIRAVLARWGRSAIEPVPVSERPWEKGGWLDLDGECWWCPPDGPAYWSMANPAMVYGGWVLPAHALPVPISQGETHHD